MPKTAIVTDTNSSLSKTLCESLGIIQVPIQIMFGDETYLTGEQIGDEKLFKMIDERQILPTTAAPPSEFGLMAYRMVPVPPDTSTAMVPSASPAHVTSVNSSRSTCRRPSATSPCTSHGTYHGESWPLSSID